MIVVLCSFSFSLWSREPDFQQTMLFSQDFDSTKSPNHLKDGNRCRLIYICSSLKHLQVLPSCVHLQQSTLFLWMSRVLKSGKWQSSKTHSWLFGYWRGAPGWGPLNPKFFSVSNFLNMTAWMNWPSPFTGVVTMVPVGKTVLLLRVSCVYDNFTASSRASLSNFQIFRLEFW